MTRGPFVAAAMTASLLLAAPAHADRVVDYTIDEATARRNATEQDVALAPLPVRGPDHLAVEIAPDVDHKVVRVGIACAAWTVQNPVSTLLRRYMTAWDRDGAPATATGPTTTLLVRIDRAGTLSRCVATGEMKARCITRVSIDGTATRTGGTARPFHVEREEAAKGVGACAGLTRGIGLVSRQAAASLVAELRSTAG